MAQGKTRLAVWSTDDTLRFYELTETGFAQVGSVGLAHYATATSAGRYPFLKFVRDSEFVSAFWQWGGSNPTLSAFRITGDEVGKQDYFDSGQFEYLSGWTDDFLYHAAIPTDAVSTPLPRSFTIDAAGAVTLIGTTNNFSDNASARSFAFSPDGQFAVLGKDAGESHVYALTAPNVAAPEYSSATLAHSAPIDAVAWSHDSRFFFAIDRSSGGAVTVFRHGAGDAFDQVAQISAAYGDPHAVAASRDNRHIAVSYYDGSAYTTAIYRRFGNAFQFIQALPVAMGRLLGFSGDGALLIDTAAKRAFLNVDGVFTEQVDLLANVASGARSQAVSGHFEPVPTEASLYNGALHAFVNGDVDLSALNLVLLTDSATFDATDAAFSDVSNAGAFEAHGFNWPQGGIALENVGLNDLGSEVSALVADDASLNIIGGALDFRYALIVENGTIPRIFIDPNQAVSVAAGKELSFALTSGFLKFSV